MVSILSVRTHETKDDKIPKRKTSVCIGGKVYKSRRQAYMDMGIPHSRLKKMLELGEAEYV